ncbi:DUF3667 domain-containing protein [Arsukibacterium sp.]|uniref:DUF3667 domain-containing protein n=1 Tax=Arsukibacterium sp. TaxID=1977258 RepID=UPI00299E1752|nr:DUF3667 domain-containing protein [Arsukibacterium sp.]MDX1678741.1 DUF3667 domain-containing protein [Arsukibacterium sp.]
METTAAQSCDNCHSPLYGDFCHQCGQEKKSYIRNVGGVITEFFGEFSNWDTRVWQTLFPLWFRPGFLSRRYVAGHRVPYVPPLRLYLFTSIIAFLIYAQLLPEQSVKIQGADSNTQQQIAEEQKKAREVWSETMSKIDRDTARADTSVQPSPQAIRISFLSDEAQQEFNRKLKQITDNPKLAINKFFSLAPQMMFLLLPLFALLLKLLYIRSDRYYMEHLIVALHSHSFILQMFAGYLGLSLLAASVKWPWLKNGIEWLALLVFFWIPVYLLLCQKNYYRQGWGKTLLKFWLTSTLYSVLFISALLSIIVLSILWA